MFFRVIILMVVGERFYFLRMLLLLINAVLLIMWRDMEERSVLVPAFCFQLILLLARTKLPIIYPDTLNMMTMEAVRFVSSILMPRRLDYIIAPLTRTNRFLAAEECILTIGDACMLIIV